MNITHVRVRKSSGSCAWYDGLIGERLEYLSCAFCEKNEVWFVNVLVGGGVKVIPLKNVSLVVKAEKPVKADTSKPTKYEIQRHDTAIECAMKLTLQEIFGA